MERSEIRGKLAAMVRYRRNFVPGGTFFFTVTVDDRRSSMLVEHVAFLRAAFRKTRGEQPFRT
jgi:putative transposase